MSSSSSSLSSSFEPSHPKRLNADLYTNRSLSPESSTNKRHELDLGTKPGRKPLQSEPKNKRTAQNRALQRLFRERKERRMKELEDKVADLEGEKLELNNESEFLRIQVETLMSELKKFRGDDDISNLLPKKVPALTTKSSSKNSDFSTQSEESTPGSSIDSSHHNNIKKENSSTDFQWGSSTTIQGNKLPYHANTAISSVSSTSLLDKSEMNTPRLLNNPGLSNNDSISSNSSSVSTSNSPNDLQDLGMTKDDGIFPIFNQSLRRSSILNDEIRGTDDEPFDEKLSEFCTKLSEACGNKTCPVPKNYSSVKGATSTAFTGNTLKTANSTINAPPQFDETPLSPFNIMINEQIASQTQQQQQQQDTDPYSFFDQSPFDPSIAFDVNDYGDFLDKDQSQNDDLQNLVTEESLYDPLGMFSTGKNNTSTISPLNQSFSPPFTNTTSDNSKDEEIKLSGNWVQPTTLFEGENLDVEENAVVPSTDGQMMKCSAIWDRITQHPRYTEIDIEGLCSELKEKLKCSSKGAVVDANEVNKLLDGSYLIKNHK